MLALATQLYEKVASPRFRASLKPSEAILEGAYEVDGSFFGKKKFGQAAISNRHYRS